MSTTGGEILFWYAAARTLLLWGHGDIQYCFVASPEGSGAICTSSGVIWSGQKFATGTYVLTFTVYSIIHINLDIYTTHWNDTLYHWYVLYLIFYEHIVKFAIFRKLEEFERYLQIP